MSQSLQLTDANIVIFISQYLKTNTNLMVTYQTHPDYLFSPGSNPGISTFFKSHLHISHQFNSIVDSKFLEDIPLMNLNSPLGNT